MRITESRLRRIIRRVIKESMGGMQDLDSAVEACKSRGLNDPDDPSHYDNDYNIELKIMNYILDYHENALDRINIDSGEGPLDLRHYGSDYTDELDMQREKRDYEEVIQNMSPGEYQAMISACRR